MLEPAKYCSLYTFVYLLIEYFIYFNIIIIILISNNYIIGIINVVTWLHYLSARIIIKSIKLWKLRLNDLINNVNESLKLK